MERIVHKSRGHKEAEQWDIEQQMRMTPRERMAAARTLIKQFYGTDVPDVRESREWKKRKIHT
jgi:hypothetical protein